MNMSIPKHLFHLVLTLFLGLIGATASAASFDCKLARGKVDDMICTDSSLSKLDEQLDAAYAQFQKSSSGGKAEKAIQLAWLKTRNKCTDRVCLQRSYESRIAELRSRTGAAGPFVGFWKKEYSCRQSTGTYQDMCKQGARDVFELAIAVNGDHVCIIHMATAQLGNRVDEADGPEPSMTGKADGNGAMVQFHSSWGGTGTALLRVEGNVLYWKVRAKDDEESWIPDEAVLSRIPAGASDRVPECKS